MGVAGVPPTQFARVADGSQVAYQVVGDGPVDVLVSRATYFPIDMMWEQPRLLKFLNRLSKFSRHIWFDPRGTGASDASHHDEDRLLETVVDDMVAVLDAVGCQQAALLALAVPIPLLFAATHPDRTAALVLADTTARVRRADNYPEGLPGDRENETLDATRGIESVGPIVAPTLVDDVEFQGWFERAQRLTCAPAERTWRMRGTFALDVRPVLTSIRVPTMVINHVDRRTAVQSRYLADRIDGAKRLDVPGADYVPFANRQRRASRRGRGIPDWATSAGTTGPGARHRDVHGHRELDWRKRHTWATGVGASC